MKALMAMAILMIGATGCSSTHAAAPDPIRLSTEFTKAGKYSYALINQAWMGRRVMKTDVTRALAELDSVSSSIREKEIHTTLYLAALHVEEEKFDLKESKLAFACLEAADSALRFTPALAADIPDTFPADYEKCTNPPAAKKKGEKK